MKDFERFKLQVPLLKTKKYYSWSSDMEVTVRRSDLWRFVLDPKIDEISERAVDGNDEDKRNLAFASILTSVSNSCKALI